MKFSTYSVYILISTITAVLFSGQPAFCKKAECQQPVNLRILSGPKGGQWFLMAEPITKILSEEVLPASFYKGGGISNLEKINNKAGDFGFSFTSFLGGAASGAPEYANIKAENVSVIGNIYPQVLYFLVRTEFTKKYNIHSVEELMQLEAPVRFALLKKGTGSEFVVRILFKYGYETDYKKLRERGWQFFFNNYSETADNFVAGNLDCFAYTAGTHVPLLLDMENYTKFTALPISNNVINNLKERFKFNSYTIDPNVYAGITQPINTLSDFTCMIVRKDLPDDVVEHILTALWRHKKEIGNTLVEFNNLSPNTAIPPGVPTHPGAEQFWQKLQGK